MGKAETTRTSCSAAGIHTFALIYCAYVGLLVARKNYGLWIPYVLTTLDVDKRDVGAIGSSYEIASGTGALFNGIVIDSIDPGAGLAAALAATATINLLLSRCSSLHTMAALWGVNGLVQSLGWPCVSKIFLRAFPEPSTRGVWYSLLSTSQNVGAALVPLLVTSSVALTGDGRSAFVVPAVVALCLCVALVHGVVARPGAAKAAASRRGEAPAVAGAISSAGASGARVISSVATDWRLWVMGLNYFCIGVIRSCVADWTPLYVQEAKGLTLAVASQCLCAFEVGGFLGSLAAGRLSDLVFGGRRGPVVCVCTALLCPALCALAWTPSALALSAAYFAVGFLAFPVHVLLGLASRELVAPEAASTAGGLVKFVAQLGASSAGYPLGHFQRHYGWRAVFCLLSAVGLGGGLLSSCLWHTRPRSHLEAPCKALDPSRAQLRRGG